MDTKKAQEYMSKADMIVQFIKTGEIEDPNLLNDQDTELSDVLSDVLNNYSEEDQTDIFTQILDDEDEEKVEYIEDFIEKNMDAVPLAIARDFVIEGSKRARKRIFIAIAEDEITFDDDPILFYELKDELSPNSSDDDFIEYLHSDDPDPYIIERMADKYPLDAAEAYYNIGESLLALKTYLQYEEILDDLDDEDQAEWLVELLKDNIAENKEEVEEIIRKVNLGEKIKEKIYEICSEDDPNLATKVRELWEVKRKRKSIEKEENYQPSQKKKKDEQPSEELAVDVDDGNALFALYQEKGGIKILRKAAKLGHAEAQYQLGLYLLELHQSTPFWKKAIKVIKGKTTNKEKAMRWFKKAAKQGHADAKSMLKK